MKRGVITFDVIVYAIIAIVLLAVVLFFISGPVSASFKQAKAASEPTEGDVVAAQSRCNQYCLQAGSLSNSEFWQRSSYCTITSAFDKNKDGRISADEKINCWQAPILVDCSTKISGISVDQNSCQPAVVVP